MRRIAFFLGFFLAFAQTCLAQERLRVVATTSDLRSLAKAVGAERISVSSLVPPGQRVEDYQPKLQDVTALERARVLLRAGPGIDPWLERLLARAAAKNGGHGIGRGEPGYLDLSLAIAGADPLGVTAGFARSGPQSRSNPHYWLDPKTAEPVTAQILAVFSRLDPDNARYYEDNRKAFLARLNGKMREWDARLAPLRGVPMIAFHDDWNYFARRFGLNIVDFMTTRDRLPPRRTKLAQLTKLIRERGVRFIISEINEPARHAQRLARQSGAKVVELAGSVGEAAGDGDYISLFESNVSALLAAQTTP